MRNYIIDFKDRNIRTDLHHCFMNLAMMKKIISKYYLMGYDFMNYLAH